MSTPDISSLDPEAMVFGVVPPQDDPSVEDPPEDPPPSEYPSDDGEPPKAEPEDPPPSEHPSEAEAQQSQQSDVQSDGELPKAEPADQTAKYGVLLTDELIRCMGCKKTYTKTGYPRHAPACLQGHCEDLLEELRVMTMLNEMAVSGRRDAIAKYNTLRLEREDAINKLVSAPADSDLELLQKEVASLQEQLKATAAELVESDGTCSELMEITEQLRAENKILADQSGNRLVALITEKFESLIEATGAIDQHLDESTAEILSVMTGFSKHTHNTPSPQTKEPARTERIPGQGVADQEDDAAAGDDGFVLCYIDEAGWVFEPDGPDPKNMKFSGVTRDLVKMHLQNPPSFQMEEDLKAETKLGEHAKWTQSYPRFVRDATTWLLTGYELEISTRLMARYMRDFSFGECSAAKDKISEIQNLTLPALKTSLDNAYGQDGAAMIRGLTAALLGRKRFASETVREFCGLVLRDFNRLKRLAWKSAGGCPVSEVMLTSVLLAGSLLPEAVEVSLREKVNAGAVRTGEEFVSAMVHVLDPEKDTAELLPKGVPNPPTNKKVLFTPGTAGGLSSTPVREKERCQHGKNCLKFVEGNCDLFHPCDRQSFMKMVTARKKYAAAVKEWEDKEGTEGRGKKPKVADHKPNFGKGGKGGGGETTNKGGKGGDGNNSRSGVATEVEVPS